MLTRLRSLGIVQDLLPFVKPCFLPLRAPALTCVIAPLKHHQCHMPLAPIEPGSDDEEAGMNHHVRLLEEEEGVPRPSEEELAWRSRS